MKKVLIITYYWPPGGGAGVQRWLKFVKYLRDFGYEPVVYTPSNPENPVDDISLLKDIPSGLEVLKTAIWEPYGWYKRFVGRKPGEKINTGFLSEHKKGGWTEKIAVWLRGNIFIPDARKYWIKPSVSFLTGWLQKNKVDVIVSTGPPHSMHLIALALKKKLHIPWLADFRDPWTNIDYYKDLMLTSLADKKHHDLEREVLTSSDAVVTIGDTMRKDFEHIAPRSVDVITNGYDEEDRFSGELCMDGKFSLAHIGTLVKTRNPSALWNVLHELVLENPDFAEDLEIKLIGKVDVIVSESIREKELGKFVKKTEYLNHEEVIRMQQQAQVLLLLLNNTPNARGILTGKFFEYLAAGRPVLCIGPVDGDVATIIRETACGVTVDFYNEQQLRACILNFYAQYKSGKLVNISHTINQYSRKALTGKLAVLLNRITQK